MAPLTPSSWTLALRDPDGTPVFDGPAQAWCADGALAVAFAGALANAGELDRALGASRSDAERVLRAFRRHGDGLAARLKGIFAFVVVDAAGARVLAGRDRIGVVPLFHASHGGRLVFSPSLRRLHAHAAVPRGLNPLVLAQHLTDQWGDGLDTYEQAIRRVPPASVLPFRAGRPQAAQGYWNPSGLREGDAVPAVAAQLQERLDAAIRHALSLGPGGVFLSGGVDSISVAALATRASQGLRGAPPTALSLYYRGYELDEETVQKQVAGMLGLPQIGIALDDAIDGRPALSAMLELSAQWPVPMGNIWLAAFLRLGTLGRDAGAEVILTGGGGDEWLGIGPFLGADYLRTLRLPSWLRFLAYMRRSYGMPLPAVLHSLVWRFGFKQLAIGARNHLLPALGHDLDASRARRSLADWALPREPLRAQVIDCLAAARRSERLARNAAASLYDHEAQRGLWHPLVQAEVENKAWMSEAIGARLLEPYWDADVVELLYRTPPDILSHGGMAKGIVHQLLRDTLPGFTIPRQNKVSLVPFYRSRIRRDAAVAWQQSGGVTALADLGLVEPTRLAARVERIMADAQSHELWLIPHVLALEAWVRTHG